MIDLKPLILRHLLSFDEVQATIAPYHDSRRVFTRRPAPTDGGAQQYPMILISAPIGDVDRDFVDHEYRDVTHYLSIYGRAERDEARAVEALAHAISVRYSHEKAHPSPVGWSVVDTRAALPIEAPDSDAEIIGFVVSVKLSISKRN